MKILGPHLLAFVLNYLFFIQKYNKQADYPYEHLKARCFCASFSRIVCALCLFNICYIACVVLFNTLSNSMRLCFVHGSTRCFLTCYCKGRETWGLCSEVKIFVIFTEQGSWKCIPFLVFISVDGNRRLVNAFILYPGLLDFEVYDCIFKIIFITSISTVSNPDVQVVIYLAFRCFL